MSCNKLLLEEVLVWLPGSPNKSGSPPTNHFNPLYKGRVYRSVT